MASSIARREYDLQLHRAYLQVVLAVMRRDDAPPTSSPVVRAQLERELATLDDELAGLADAPGRPMSRLAMTLMLDDDVVEFVWLAVALAANPPLRFMAQRLDDRANLGATTTLFARVTELPPARARALALALLGDHPLLRHGLLTVADRATVPSAWPLAPALELIAHLADEPRDRGGCVRLTAPTDVVHDDAQRAALQQIAAPLASGARQALFVEGPALSGRRTAVALASPRPALAIDLTHAPTAATLAPQLQALAREAMLDGAIPVLCGLEQLATGEARDERLPYLRQFIDGLDGPVVLVASRAGIDLGTKAPTLRIGWNVPAVEARVRLWTAHGAPAPEARRLATRYPLGPGDIARAVASARLAQGGAPVTELGAFIAGVRHNIAERLGTLADLVPVRQTWSDLVLADDVLEQVRGLVARVRDAHVVLEQWGYRSKMPRGAGVAALFSGPPGTGKTMVAGLIAAELELDLYQVDLSKVMSKWVGETEKQLAMIFDAAEAGQALLLFDEADALFGQRTADVKSANDRYANLEVNFLLQRIERFGGVVILTTNLDTNIDSALKRRLASHIVFPQPDDDERAQLWQRMLTADGAPLAPDLDVAALARAYPKMSGANIRNAALAAAFLAAAHQRPVIDQATVLRAARGEYMAMGLVLSA